MPGLVHLGLPVGETPLRRLTPYGLDVWRIPVTRGQLLRVEAPSPEANVMVRLHFPTLPDARNAVPAAGGQETGSQGPGFRELPGDPKRPQDLIARIGGCVQKK